MQLQIIDQTAADQNQLEVTFMTAGTHFHKIDVRCFSLTTPTLLSGSRPAQYIPTKGPYEKL